MFMVLSSWQSHCKGSPGSFDECRMTPSGRGPKTKPDDLGCESACTGCQKLHPPSPFIFLLSPKADTRFIVRCRLWSLYSTTGRQSEEGRGSKDKEAKEERQEDGDGGEEGAWTGDHR